MDRIERLQIMLIEQPDDAFVQHALALEFIKIGDDEAAEKLFISILKREPDYVGSYYHLARLLERQGSNEKAITVYEEGMKMAKATNDQHAYNELMMARDDNDAFEL